MQSVCRICSSGDQNGKHDEICSSVPTGNRSVAEVISFVPQFVLSVIKVKDNTASSQLRQKEERGKVKNGILVKRISVSLICRFVSNEVPFDNLESYGTMIVP
jgi:hypothetical protein